MGKRGPKPGTMTKRPRDKTGRYTPVVEPIKSWPVAEVLPVIASKYGLRTQIVEQLGCDLETLKRYEKQFEEISAALNFQRERMKDIGELSLFRAVMAGEAWAVCFFLKTQAKDRGYIERQEVTGAGGKPIQQEVKVAIDFGPYAAAFGAFFAVRDRDGLSAPTDDGDGQSLDTLHP